MMNKSDNEQMTRFIYRYIAHEQELSLCSLEIRQLFGKEASWHQSTAVVESRLDISAQRSPYMKYRLHVWLSAGSYDALLQQAKVLKPKKTYKMVAVETILNGQATRFPYEQRRRMERELGTVVGGNVNLQEPELLLGIIQLEGEWLVGSYEPHHGTWQQYDRKPRHYSTALSTRVARAIVNIAVPQLHSSIRFIDPCCGIGTVLLQANDQGLHVEGYDINPLAVVGARENMAAFDMNCIIKIADMRLLQETYDVAVLDLPYNHCSVLPESERREMLLALSRIAKRAVIVSVEPIEQELNAIGATILDVGHVQKTHFKRDVWLVQFDREQA